MALIGYERVYLLGLEKDHYYVGSTRREVHERYREHAEGEGSRWTFNHPPRGCVLRTLPPTFLEELQGLREVLP